MWGHVGICHNIIILKQIIIQPICTPIIDVCRYQCVCWWQLNPGASQPHSTSDVGLGWRVRSPRPATRPPAWWSRPSDCRQWFHSCRRGRISFDLVFLGGAVSRLAGLYCADMLTLSLNVFLFSRKLLNVCTLSIRIHMTCFVTLGTPLHTANACWWGSSLIFRLPSDPRKCFQTQGTQSVCGLFSRHADDLNTFLRPSTNNTNRSERRCSYSLYNFRSNAWWILYCDKSAKRRKLGTRSLSLNKW